MNTCLTSFFPLLVPLFLHLFSLPIGMPLTFHHSLPPPHQQKRTPRHMDAANHYTLATFSQSFVMALINN